ncbi:hypothetical protein AK88_03010 [Plasmodium fragile]|uniref:rRNA methyltransferase 1, mitochondrial n=1 Tax=Plasmodium fragile TaxID=5857 RepID=A0A0D9QJT9_PLAFR|nr:uncharacterized protein AK88_03010 [Plasmodium fragile]KJP87330.1 hypothetical protein AK88_03010 [Plasmodium fragile]
MNKKKKVTPFGVLPEFRPNLPPRRPKGPPKKTYSLSSPHRNDKSDTPLVNIKRNNFLEAQAENDIDYVYGINSVLSVLMKKERTIHKVLINEKIRMNKKTRKHAYQYIFNTLKKRNIPITTTSKRKMDDLVGGFPHNDIIMQTNYRTMKKAKHFLKDYPQKGKQANIYICLHDVVGTSEFLNFFHVNDMLTFMDELRSSGFKILSTCCRPNDSSSNNRLEQLANVQISKNEKIFIILGNETKGLSKEILDRSDICIYINGHRTEEAPPTPDLNPNANFTLDSLNVNNACAILLHHFTSHLS